MEILTGIRNLGCDPEVCSSNDTEETVPGIVNNRRCGITARNSTPDSDSGLASFLDGLRKIRHGVADTDNINHLKTACNLYHHSTGYTLLAAKLGVACTGMIGHIVNGTIHLVPENMDGIHVPAPVNNNVDVK